MGRMILLPALLLLLSGCQSMTEASAPVTLAELPAFDGETAWVELESGEPSFTEADLGTAAGFESYAPLDLLGRPGQAFALVGPETMPTQERGNIGMVRPAGWHLAKYDCVEGKYLYNRCHLIGYQLTAENANEQNLITGTRYLNIDGMLSFENQIAEYVEETSNHVLYRVTPVYEGSELLARGLVMEALSVEDDGAGVRFHVYAYNAQPGVEIDYATGESWLAGEMPASANESEEAQASEGENGECVYVVNVNSGKFHLPECSGVASMLEQNRMDTNESKEELLAQGYEPCGQCKP